MRRIVRLPTKRTDLPPAGYPEVTCSRPFSAPAAAVVAQAWEEVEFSVEAGQSERTLSIQAVQAARVVLLPRSTDWVPSVPWERLSCRWWRQRGNSSSLPWGAESSFACAPGTVHVEWDSGDHSFAQEFNVRPGVNRIPVQFPPASWSQATTGITLRLHEGETTIPANPWLFWRDRMSVTSTGEGEYLGPRYVKPSGSAKWSSVLNLRFSTPETYVLDLPQLEGYRPLAPLRIEVGEDDGRVIEVELSPLP